MKNLPALLLLLCVLSACGGLQSNPSSSESAAKAAGRTIAARRPRPTRPAPEESPEGRVKIVSPTGALFLSSVHFAASGSTSCAQGVASMNLYATSEQLSYSVAGAKLDTYLDLAPGTYRATVEERDNCNGSARSQVRLSVASASTTLSTQTSNNTSAADSFQQQSNGNEGASNVSKQDIHSLLYTGADTQIYAELQPWFGDKRHMPVGYTSWDPVQVERQLTDMESRGATGVVIDWYGPADDTEATTLAWLKAAPSHPGFKVMIMIDKGAISLSPCRGCNPQQTLIYLTNYVLQHYATSPSYATLNGNPLITQFDIDLHFSIDWNAVKAATSPDVAWIFENSNGFTHPITAGSWSWVNISENYGFDYLTKFYNTAHQYPQEMAWGAGYKGFNDTLASWGQGRIIDQQCGMTWLETFSLINQHYNSGAQLPILQLVTWNDYEEGTEIETGIDNCLSVSASMSGLTLQWKINGNQETIDHYVVYVSADGENLLAVDRLPADARQFDLTPFNLGNGNYVAFVQAVGKPVIRNQMSAGVPFRR